MEVVEARGMEGGREHGRAGAQRARVRRDGACAAMSSAESECGREQGRGNRRSAGQSDCGAAGEEGVRVASVGRCIRKAGPLVYSITDKLKSKKRFN